MSADNLAEGDRILFTDSDVQTIAYNLSPISSAIGRLEVLLGHVRQDSAPALAAADSVHNIIVALGNLQWKLNAAPSPVPLEGN